MSPFRRIAGEAFESWPILSSTPDGILLGRSIAGFISNGQCHLTTIDVYEDGSVFCWGMVDRALFRAKVESGWVVPNPEINQNISVFEFGGTDAINSEWYQTRAGIVTEVDSVLGALNPGMINIVDMQGTSFELRNGVKIAKRGWPRKRCFRKIEGTDEVILGDRVPVLKSNGDEFEFTSLFVYADGQSRLGPSGDIFPTSELSLMFSETKISNHAAAGSNIHLPGLGRFQTTTGLGGIAVADRIGQIDDMTRALNGEPTSSVICRARFKAYQDEPSPQNRDALREAYLAVPTHHRRYLLGDMDRKDGPIRAVLFPRS